MPAFAEGARAAAKAGHAIAPPAAEIAPSTSHAVDDVACVAMRAGRTGPVAAMPVATPEKTVPARAKPHEETKTSPQALATPAAKRSATHAAIACVSAIAAVVRTIAASPRRTIA